MKNKSGIKSTMSTYTISRRILSQTLINVYDDDGKLLLGNFCTYREDLQNVADLIADAIKNPPEDMSRISDVKRTLARIEEEMKFRLIKAIKNNPSITLTKVLAELNWWEKGIFAIVLKVYVHVAVDRALYPAIPVDTMQDYWTAFVAIIGSLTDAQIEKILR